MLQSENLSNALRAIASALQSPVLFILLLLIGVVIVMVGTLIVEIFTERRLLKAKLPVLVDQIKAGEEPLEDVIENGGLLRRQTKALLELVAHEELTPVMRESLAVRLIYEEQVHYDRTVKITDLIARIGPMFGLLGTLIPLGPGIIALGRGDTYTLSQSLLTAFDTTIAGLVAAAVAYVISAIRKGWYANYMSVLETAMECILEVTKDGSWKRRPDPEPEPEALDGDEKAGEEDPEAGTAEDGAAEPEDPAPETETTEAEVNETDDETVRVGKAAQSE